MYGDQRRGQMAKNLIVVRTIRAESFPSELFDEHAWNMLLHLFSALTDNETVSEADLIRRADASLNFGRRWITHLVKDGQIEARSDGDDVALTASAIERMRMFLDRAENIQSTTFRRT